MKKYISNMPAWLTILLTASFILSFLLIANPAKQAALISGIAKEKSRNIQLGVFAFFVSWLIYASVLSLKGVFDVNSLPPRVIVFTTIPLFVFLFAIIGSTRLYKRLLQSAPLESLIRIHIFRFEGVLFIILFLYHLLPVKFALSAGLGDMLTALFAIPVARAVSQKKSWSIKAVYAWNIFGILDIVSLMTLATIAAGKAAATGEPGITEMTMFPFVWFPAFAPATILFLQFGIFKKLQQRKHETISKFEIIS